MAKPTLFVMMSHLWLYSKLKGITASYYVYDPPRHIDDCPPYAAVNRWRSSFPGRRCQCLERFAAPCDVGTLSDCLPQSPQDAPLQALLSIMPFRCCACEVTLVIVGHINRFFLLTCCSVPDSLRNPDVITDNFQRLLKTFLL